jgi:hypothetical protein
MATHSEKARSLVDRSQVRRRGEEKNKMAPLFERAGKMMCSTRYKRRGTNLAAAVQTDTLLLIMVALALAKCAASSARVVTRACLASRFIWAISGRRPSVVTTTSLPCRSASNGDLNLARLCHSAAATVTVLSNSYASCSVSQLVSQATSREFSHSVTIQRSPSHPFHARWSLVELRLRSHKESVSSPWPQRNV